MQNLENLDVFEFLITQKLLKCPKDPFVRSALKCMFHFVDELQKYVYFVDKLKPSIIALSFTFIFMPPLSINYKKLFL